MGRLTVQPLRIAAAVALVGLALTGCGGDYGPPPPAAPAVTIEAPPPVPAPTHLSIPAIGVEGDLLALGLDDEGALDVPDGAMEVGYYAGPDPDTEGDEVHPGEVGPAVIAGHVDLRGQLGIFNRLDELQPGDLVYVDQADGGQVTFVVREVEQVAKDAFPTERVYGNTARPELRLITCGGALNRSTGHYTDNVIVYAEVVA